MAKKLGNDYRLWVETATTGTYAMIAGQQSLSYTRSANPIDTSTKDDFPYATTAAGLFEGGITLEGVADLPDANGYTRVETKFKAGTPVNFQIRKAGASGTTGDAVFTGECNILELSPNFGQNDSLKYTLRLGYADAPTTDALS